MPNIKLGGEDIKPLSNNSRASLASVLREAL